MKYASPLIVATSVRRYKRFILDALLDDGSLVQAHCTNTGSMLTCFEPGCGVALSKASNPARKLPFTLELTGFGAGWVGVNTANANALAAEAIQNGSIPAIGGYGTLRREVPYCENSRVDILLERPGELCYVEVKNVSMSDGEGGCCFPDAVSARGVKHLHDLCVMKAEGHRAIVLFVCQCENVEYFRPAHEIDNDFADGLRQAVENGVEAIAVNTRITLESIEIEHVVPVRLS